MNAPMQRYVRTTQKPKDGICRQNLNISAQFENANFALIELVRRGVVVLSLHIEHSKPLIEVEECAALNDLPQVSADIEINGARVARAIGRLHHCNVVWIKHKETQL